MLLPGGLDAPDGESIHLDVRTVDATDPQAAKSVPEMAALVTEGMNSSALSRVEGAGLVHVKTCGIITNSIYLISQNCNISTRLYGQENKTLHRSKYNRISTSLLPARKP